VDPALARRQIQGCRAEDVEAVLAEAAGFGLQGSELGPAAGGSQANAAPQATSTGYISASPAPSPQEVNEPGPAPAGTGASPNP